MSSNTTKQFQCNLRSCVQAPLDESMARVEVKAFEVPELEIEEMYADWAEDGEAMFHDTCWRIIVRSYKNGEPLALNETEREMLKEAKKTAEYFDSKAKIRFEASRIAHMLLTAKHAIAFTGNWSFPYISHQFF